MKKLTSLFLALMMVFALIPATAFASDVMDSGDYGCLTYTFTTDGTLTINGNGCEVNSTGIAPWNDYCNKITAVVVNEGVTGVGNFTFTQCINLARVSLPKTLASIDMSMFRGCTSLSEITIPASVKTILPFAFMDCNNLKTVIFEGDVPSFDSMAFFNICPNAKVNDTVGHKLFGDAYDNSTVYTINDIMEHNTAQEHEHDYSMKIVEKPTCTNRGYATYTCECGDSYEDYVPATGHDYNREIVDGIAIYTCSICGDSYERTISDEEDEEPIHEHNWECTDRRNATCTDDGELIYTCSICGETYSDPLYAYDHCYNDEITTAPTCTKDGVMTYTCDNCGDTYTEVIPAISHKYTATVTEPTCTKDGAKVYTCDNCGDTYTEAIPAIGHKYTCVTKNATCTANGSKTYTCQNCGHTYSETIKATGHKYTSAVTKKATCTANGIRTYTCSVCGNKYTETIKATGHKAVTDKAVAATYTKAGKTAGSHCSVCGKVITAQKSVAMKKLGTPSMNSVANGYGKITVKWTKVTGATGYRVYRRMNSGNWTLIKTVSGNSTTSYDDTKATTNGAKYQYKVCAIASVNGKVVNTGACSAYKGTYRLATPSITSATNTAGKKITVKWNKNSKATGYQVKLVRGNKTYTANTTSLSKTWTNLTKNASYKVYVRSYKTANGVTFYSAYSSCKTVKVVK